MAQFTKLLFISEVFIGVKSILGLTAGRVNITLRYFRIKHEVNGI